MYKALKLQIRIESELFGDISKKLFFLTKYTCTDTFQLSNKYLLIVLWVLEIYKPYSEEVTT